MFVTLPILVSLEAHTTKSTIEVHVMLRLWLFQVLNTLMGAFMFWDARSPPAFFFSPPPRAAPT